MYLWLVNSITGWKDYFSSALNNDELSECENQHLDLQGIDTKEDCPYMLKLTI
jgi:hypothetical protein